MNSQQAPCHTRGINMSQTFAAAQTITKDGQYRVRAVRGADAFLSVYVNRVKRLSSEADTVEGVLLLEVGDVVEATGTMAIEVAA